MKILAIFALCLILSACGQPSIQQDTVDLPTIQPASNSSVVAAAGAITTITNVSDPVDFTQLVPCAGGTGEDVHLFGTIHTVIRTTINGNKVGIKTHSNPRGVSGVGLLSGNRYRGTGVTQETSNEGMTHLGETETFINTFNIIGQGKGNNLLIHENAHITVNANGTVTSFIDNFHIECK